MEATGIYAYDSSSRHFTGKERDQESGLDYFGARYYGSALGRFTSPDWSETPEPVPHADLRDPQTLNLYGYIRNNPLSRNDPTGHCPPCVVEVLESPVFQEAIEEATPYVSSATGALVGAWIGTRDSVQKAVSDFVTTGPMASPDPGHYHAMAVADNAEREHDAQAGSAGGERAGKNFTPKGKQEVKDQNAAANGGQTT
jgi:RHS repeat-associated protein